MDGTLAFAASAAVVAALLAAVATRWLLLGRGVAERGAARRRAEARDARLAKREETLDAMLASVREREARAEDRERQADKREREAQSLLAKRTAELARVAGMSVKDARRELRQREEEAVRRQARRLAADLEAQAREQAEHRARDLVCTAIQRLALSTAVPSTTVLVPVPDGDMKGRIIGKEGRNIRIFEERTGVNVVLDDVPTGVMLSCFDPRRREVARVALTELIAHGYIYPSSIEREVALAEERVSVEAERAVVEAAAEARVGLLPPELAGPLGDLYLRTGYGQNMLQHSVEVAHLAGLMAQELGVDAELARRAGLLHDIGKALGPQAEGGHARAGARLAAQHGEAPEICHAIEAHHGDPEPASPEAVVVQVADMISLSRPGGRREPLEQHMSRLRRIEELCLAFDGVERVHAMQSGRDIRVMVSPALVGDDDTRELARRIAARVEDETPFSGRVSVTVVRELRATEIVR